MKKTIEEHLKVNIKEYLVLAIILLLGLIVGIISVNHLNIEQREELNSYLMNFLDGLKNNNEINYSLLLENSIKKNMIFVAILVLLSFSIWKKIGTLALIGYKGFSLGYSISTAIVILGVGKGLIFTVSLIFLSELIYIPAVFYISVLSSNNYIKLIDGNYDDKRVIIIEYVIKLLIALSIIFISSLMKTYLSSNLFLLFVNYF